MTKGTLVASAVASLMFAGIAQAKGSHAKKADKAEATVHCAGINACKGQASCSGASNACKGQNSCKGQGWVEASAKDCTAKKGTVASEK
jgi:hypothetical protein